MKKSCVLSIFILLSKILIGQMLPFNSALKPFYHGVASGDPLEDKVIIWTRVTPDNLQFIKGTYVIARDTALTNIVKIDTFSTDWHRDYTVKIDVTGLQSNTTYYYAFIALGKRSPIGRTKTTPSVSSNNLTDVLKLAVMSCANYEAGYFNAYARVAERNDINAVIHLGDYYYDYSKGSHRNSGLKDLSRSYIPINETTTKNDYRLRQSLYHLDADLQRLHQQHPFIVTWDDHEIANNAYETGAKNFFSTKNEWEKRKQAAKEVYFEWMPIRGTAENRVFYRAFSYGKLLDLFMLDTRLEGREKQPPNFDTPDDTLNPRKMISNTQQNWLVNNLKKSKARWKVVGSQVVFSNINLGFATFLPNSRMNTRVFQNLFLDSWQGYLLQRNSILDAIQKNKVNNVVIISGDSHSSWSFDLNKMPVVNFYNQPKRSYIPRSNPYDTVTSYGYNAETGAGSQGVEFSSPAIASRSFPNIISPSMIAGWEARSNTPRTRLKGSPNYNPHLKFMNMNKNGYFVLDVRADSVQCDYFFVPTIFTKSDKENWARGLSSRSNSNRITTVKTSKYAPAKAEQDVPAPPPKVVLASKALEQFFIFSIEPSSNEKSINFQYGLNTPSDIDISVVSMEEKTVKSIAQIKKQKAGVSSTADIDVSNLETGSYYLKIKTDDAVIMRKLIVK